MNHDKANDAPSWSQSVNESIELTTDINEKFNLASQIEDGEKRRHENDESTSTHDMTHSESLET